MAQRLSELGPLDNFKIDDNHRIFGEKLKEMEKVVPNIEEIPLNIRDSVPDITQRKSMIDGLPSRSPIIVEDEIDRVTLVMGADQEVVVSCPKDHPMDVDVFMDRGRGSSIAEIVYTKTFFRASVAKRDQEASQLSRNIAKAMAGGAAVELLDLGRADIVGAIREFFSMNRLLGVKAHSPK